MIGLLARLTSATRKSALFCTFAGSLGSRLHVILEKNFILGNMVTLNSANWFLSWSSATAVHHGRSFVHISLELDYFGFRVIAFRDVDVVILILILAVVVMLSVVLARRT
jgi:hypothetical protein